MIGPIVLTLFGAAFVMALIALFLDDEGRRWK